MEAKCHLVVVNRLMDTTLNRFEEAVQVNNRTFNRCQELGQNSNPGARLRDEARSWDNLGVMGSRARQPQRDTEVCFTSRP